jgi:RNA polymerase sigma factor (sigma-70 family)
MGHWLVTEMMSESARSPLVAAYADSYDELVGYVRARVGCSATAADIVQETYLRATASPHRETLANPRAFLYRVAGNLAVDHLRQLRSRAKYVVDGPVPEQHHPQAPSPEQELGDRRRLIALVAAVEELPPRCREVFILRKFDDLPQEEIARRLGISRNMVEKHLRHALLHCMQRLGEERR